MKNFNKEGIKSDKGFTMIELIIVIAIMGILAAILVPSFTQMTRKSRLKADISTIKQFQTQMDLYVADHDGQYPTATGGSDVEPTTALLGAIADELVAENYLKASDIETGVGPVLQTAGAEAIYDGGAGVEMFKLDVGGCVPNIQDTAGGLGPKELAMMEGYTTP